MTRPPSSRATSSAPASPLSSASSSSSAGRSGRSARPARRPAAGPLGAGRSIGAGRARSAPAAAAAAAGGWPAAGSAGGGAAAAAGSRGAAPGWCTGSIRQSTPTTSMIACRSTSSWPPAVKPLTEPASGKPRVSARSSSPSTWTLSNSSIQVTRRLALTCSRTSGHIRRTAAQVDAARRGCAGRDGDLGSDRHRPATAPARRGDVLGLRPVRGLGRRLGLGDRRGAVAAEPVLARLRAGGARGGAAAPSPRAAPPIANRRSSRSSRARRPRVGVRRRRRAAAPGRRSARAAGAARSRRASRSARC